MGFVTAVLMMAVVILLAYAVSRWNVRAAYRILDYSHNFFEPEPHETEKEGSGDRQAGKAAAPTKVKNQKSTTKRAYISQYSKKIVGARQHWRCAACGKILDASYEIDHIIPVHRGGGNDLSNLQALCRSPCHIQKSISEQSQG